MGFPLPPIGIREMCALPASLGNVQSARRKGASLLMRATSLFGAPLGRLKGGGSLKTSATAIVRSNTSYAFYFRRNHTREPCRGSLRQGSSEAEPEGMIDVTPEPVRPVQEVLAELKAAAGVEG
jgi:hypothetical protein